MIKKTKDYDMFTFRQDNRERIDKLHVKKLVESIKSRNLLEFRPIVVNEKLEIIDGQHRVVAAKELGVEIYYQEEKKLVADDIIRMNISKSWTIGDYQNFYYSHGYAEYVKLGDFVNKNQIALNIAINIAIGGLKPGYTDFKNGKFIFNDESIDPILEMCWDTISCLKKMNGYSRYVHAARFWRALIILTKHDDYDHAKWLSNIKKMSDKFIPKSTTNNYLKLFQTVYNFRNENKITLFQGDID